MRAAENLRGAVFSVAFCSDMWYHNNERTVIALKNGYLPEKILKSITEYSKSVFGDKLKSVILYGSYARGDYRSDSDMDIMIMVDMQPEELAAYRWDLSCLSADLSVENDVLVSSKLQSAPLFDKWKDTLPFYKNVVKDGIVYA